MPRLPYQFVVPALVALAIATSACSKGTMSSPLAPSQPASPSSPATPTPAAAQPGASISGLVVASSQPAGLTAMGAGFGKVTVSVNGTSISVVSDDSGAFALQNVPAGSVTLTITGTGVSAQVTVGTVNINDDLRLTVRLSGSSAVVDDSRHQSADNQVELSGTITAISGSSFTMGAANTVVSVPATATVTRSGATVATSTLSVGARVEVHGVLSGATVVASRVNIESSASGTDDHGSNSGNDSADDASEAKVSGAITSISTTSCPSISFMVGTVTVTTNGSTNFDDVRCSSLAKGDTVSVEGTRQANGSILASEVKKTSATTTGGTTSGSGSNSGSGSSGSGSGSGSRRD